jgi:hypothetical protein
MKNSIPFTTLIPEKYHSIRGTIQEAVEIAVQAAEVNGMRRQTE